jgi:hypothetical protein
MVNAILDGNKTQTRRLAKTPPMQDGCHVFAPKVEIGDVLWVRETWQHTKILNLSWDDENYGYVYRADGQPWEDFLFWTWKPSIFMPKKACRLFLEVTNVRVERLHDISTQDIQKEGVKLNVTTDSAIVYDLNKKHAEISFLNQWGFNEKNRPTEKDIWMAHWASLWSTINGRKNWDANPFVWVYDFKVIERPKDFI